jgi:hypothetical protein
VHLLLYLFSSATCDWSCRCWCRGRQCRRSGRWRWRVHIRTALPYPHYADGSEKGTVRVIFTDRVDKPTGWPTPRPSIVPTRDATSKKLKAGPTRDLIPSPRRPLVPFIVQWHESIGPRLTSRRRWGLSLAGRRHSSPAPSRSLPSSTHAKARPRARRWPGSCGRSVYPDSSSEPQPWPPPEPPLPLPRSCYVPPCLALPRSSPSSTLWGRGPTPSAAYTCTGVGRPSSPPRDACGQAGALAIASGARGGARPRSPPSRAGGQLLPPRRGAHALRSSCLMFWDFLCCNCCIPMLPQCSWHVAIVRLKDVSFLVYVCKSLYTCCICVLDMLQVSHANVSKLDINFSMLQTLIFDVAVVEFSMLQTHVVGCCKH